MQMKIVDSININDIIRDESYSYEYTCVIPVSGYFPDYFSNRISYVGRSIQGLREDISKQQNSQEIYERLEKDFNNKKVIEIAPKYIWFCNNVIIDIYKEFGDICFNEIISRYILINPVKRCFFELDDITKKLLGLFREIESIKVVEAIMFDYLRKSIENISLADIHIIINYLEYKGVIKFAINEKYEYHSFKDINYNYITQPMKHHVISMPEMKYFRIVLTEKCPMKCIYCYYSENYDSVRRTMTCDTIRKTIDKIVELCLNNNRNDVYIQWWGGDPAEEESLVEYGTIYAKDIFNKNNIKPHFFICSSFASNNNNDFYSFITDNKFNITLSLDGNREINNKHKVLISADGSTSYDRSLHKYDIITKSIPNVMDEIMLNNDINYSKFKFRCTLNSYDEIMDYKEICEFFNQFNRAYRICIVSDKSTMSKKSIFTNEIIEMLKYATHTLIKCKQNQEKIGSITPILCNAHTNPQSGLKFLYSHCGFGGGIIIVNPIGKMYTCHRFCDNENFCVGNIESTYNEIIKNLLPLRERLLMKYDKCLNCKMQSICTGGCAYESYERYKTIWKTSSCVSYELIKHKAILSYVAFKLYPQMFFKEYNIEDCSNIRCLWC